MRSWGCRGSCGSGLAARSCGGVETLVRAWGGFVPGWWLTPSAGGDTEMWGEPAAGLLSPGTGLLPSGQRRLRFPLSFGSGAAPGAAQGWSWVEP